MKTNQTNVYLGLVDYHQLFIDTPDAKVIPCDQHTTSKNQVQDHINSLFQNGNKDLNFIASCECGELMGNFYEGVKCKRCKTVCKTNFAEQLRFRAWLELPDFVPPILHPVAYSIIERWLGKIGQVSILQCLLDVDQELPKQLQGVMGQGFQYFYQNFDNIINYFLTEYAPLKQAAARKRAVGIREFIDKYRDIMFIRKIPVLNQALHLLTTSGTMMYSDDCSGAIIKAKIELSQMIYVYQNGAVGGKFIDQRMWEILQSVLAYVKSISEVKLIGKLGYIRKLILGARLHCSYRGVIVPIAGPHHADEIHLPWVIGVTLYKLEIINVLMNRYGYSMPQAVAKHAKALSGFDQDIADIFDILIKECQESTITVFGKKRHPLGLGVTFGRNPSLRLGAIFLLFVTKIKHEYEDNTIGLSDLVTGPPTFTSIEHQDEVKSGH